MIRRHLLALVTALAALGACNKPSQDDCRKALANMQRLMGTDQLLKAGDLDGEVRRCRGGSKRESVECAVKATTLDQLRACDFQKLPGAPATPKAGSDAGSGSGSAG
jgi:hypothetical protein